MGRRVPRVADVHGHGGHAGDVQGLLVGGGLFGAFAVHGLALAVGLGVNVLATLGRGGITGRCWSREA